MDMYLFDIGSSTVKGYKKNETGLVKILEKSFDFKKDFNLDIGLSDINQIMLFDFFDKIKSEYGLSKKNTKLYATGIFRTIRNKQSFIEKFYYRTRLFFNIISHDLENFYLEKALVGRCDINSSVMIINIGGKTTELVVMRNNIPIERYNIDLGVGSIIKQFPNINNDYSGIDLEQLCDYISGYLPPIDGIIKMAIYTGGELTYMKLVNYALTNNKFFNDPAHSLIIDAKDYYEKNKTVFNNITLNDLRILMPQNPDWMNGARACSAIAQAICRKYSIEYIVPSDSNLIDGVNIQEVKNVVICGSFNKNLPDISKLIIKLQEKGINILSPANTEVVDNIEGNFVVFKGDTLKYDCKWSIEAQHLKAIDECDLVILCNFNNYLGMSATFEAGYAYRSGKKIVFMEDNTIANDFDCPCEIGLIDRYR